MNTKTLLLSSQRDHEGGVLALESVRNNPCHGVMLVHGEGGTKRQRHHAVRVAARRRIHDTIVVESFQRNQEATPIRRRLRVKSVEEGESGVILHGDASRDQQLFATKR